MKKYFVLFLGLALAGGLAPVAASAATMRIATKPSSVDLHEPLRVDVILDMQGDVANAIQGEIVFPANNFQLEAINDGSSPVSFWIEPPKETASGTVTFSGIIPGGFIGQASSVVSLILEPIAPGDAVISLKNIMLLRNDGLGSPIAVQIQSGNVTVSATLSSSTASAAAAALGGANSVPENFTPIVSRNPNVYGGKYFLAFSTTDKGSGIDYYQVAEVPAGGVVGSTTAWHAATSPYLLTDQSLSSDIYVRAVDHAGNSIIVKVPAAHHSIIWELAIYILLALLIALGAWLLVRLWLRRRR